MVKKINCFCAYNKGEEPTLENGISFEETKILAEKRWKGQAIRRCTIFIDDDGDE